MGCKRNREKEDSKKSKKQKKDRTIGPSLQPRLSMDDYYRYNAEFRVWLLRRKGIYFDELKTSKAKKYFKKFIKKWNAGTLKEKYYGPVRSSQMSAAERTRYKWNFVKNVDQIELATVRDEVDTNTYEMGISQLQKMRKTEKESKRGEVVRRSRTELTPQEEEELEKERKRKKKQDKLYIKRRKEDLEELVPKPDPGSHKARLEKRRAKHKRPDSPEMEFREEDLIGDTQAMYSKALQEERQRQLERQEKAAKRIAELQEKERQRIEDFKRKMGLTDKFASGGVEDTTL